MKKIIIFLIIYLSSYCIWAQQIDVPHVSKVNAEIRGNLIRLTWEDSLDARGPVYIFRSPRPFLTAIPANIRPIIIRYGTQYYIDDIDDLESVYYFIAASDTRGNRYDKIVPQLNSVTVNLAQQDTPVTAAPVTTAQIPAIEDKSDIKTNIEGEKVTISFTNTNPESNVILFRSTQPVRHPQDLRNAVIAQINITDVFEEYPVPDIAWYYSVIYEDDISKGSIEIKPGFNSTTTAVIILSNQKAGNPMRSMPLPVMTPSAAGNFITNPIREMPLSRQTASVLQNMELPEKQNPEQRRPRIFVIDLQAAAGGDESALAEILRQYFEKFDFENTRLQLQHFLSLPRTKEAEARAHYYLGQALYFTGNYREALFQFMSFRAYHQVEANIWIDAVLAAMIN